VSKWRAIVAVPVAYDIGIGSDITSAMRGAQNILQNVSPCILPDGSQFEPKLISLVGPKADLDAWGKQMEDLRDIRLAAKKPPGDGDGPSAA
jgi:hypothetical protein